jgi:hypothetical protein
MTCSTPMSAPWMPAPARFSAPRKMVEDGKLAKLVDADRYSESWNTPQNQAMLAGKESLDAIAARVLSSGHRAAAEIRPAGIYGKPHQQVLLSIRENQHHGDRHQGTGIFLAQFAGDAGPFNSWDSITKWAASLGYKGVQIPSWDGRMIDLKKAAESKTYCDELKGRAGSQRCRDHRAFDPSAGPARRRSSGL